MTTLAVDPGGTTGMALRVKDTYLTITEPNPIEIYRFIMANDLAYVIVEQFVTSRIHSHKWGVITTEIVGGVIAVCAMKPVPCHRRSPHQRLPYMARAGAILRAKKEPFMDHQQDALAQLLGWERMLELQAIRKAANR